ncbi:Hypothetical protein HVR_LOCUS839 [uncultured virus]|nr:Hypothetical protein HVR_LOCUS839 [uncultured virus]
MTIRCLFVDLGDVIYTINPDQANKNLENIGSNLKFGVEQHPIIDALEIGVYTPGRFFEILRRYCHMKAPKLEFLAAFNSILDGPGFMVDRLEYLQSLKDKYPELRIYLLSNSNEIHIERLMTQAKIQGVTHLFGNEYHNGLFNNRFFSCRLKTRKPGLEVYKRACDWALVDPRDVLFIDDNVLNIKAAKRLGINTIELKTTDLESFQWAIEAWLP